MKKVTVEEVKKAVKRNRGFSEMQRVALFNIVEAIENNEHPLVESVALDEEAYLLDVCRYCTFLVLKYFDSKNILNESNCIKGEIGKKGYVSEKLIEQIYGQLMCRGERVLNANVKVEMYMVGNIQMLKSYLGEDIFTTLQLLELITSHFVKEK